MVTTDHQKFWEHKGNGLVKDVFNNQALLDKLEGESWCLCKVAGCANKEEIVVRVQAVSGRSFLMG